MNIEIKMLIEKYAEVYKGFELFQNSKNGLLSGGDQKTGVIAEYYAKCFVESTVQGLKTVEYAKPGACYDIVYTLNSGESIRVQVKGVSEHSKTRTIAPLNLKDKEGNQAFDELYLIDLDLDFLPVGLYINKFDEIIKRLDDPKRETIVGSKMKHLSFTNRLGSNIFNFSENRIIELRQGILIN